MLAPELIAMVNINVRRIERGRLIGTARGLRVIFRRASAAIAVSFSAPNASRAVSVIFFS
jgi:hypothetical protein